ncbi:hypothetical protein BJY00DRAFT_174586 [Aspergillus carlsbadensis]|nr:hypothetical protein BJY00DRAFT_174586 [Aspergillus carlsbadensis]
MSITAFHIEAFRPWKPSRSKPIPRRPPHADYHVHGDPQSDIRQSACSELSEQPVPASGGSNELFVTQVDETPAISAMRAATPTQTQTQSGSPASDLNHLGDVATTDISIGSRCSYQGAAGCRSPSPNSASSAQQSPGPHQPAVILIDPAILRNEFPLELSQPYQHIRESDTLWSSQRELPCPYPEPPIVSHGIFNNDYPSLGIIDDNSPATHC